MTTSENLNIDQDKNCAYFTTKRLPILITLTSRVRRGLVVSSFTTSLVATIFRALPVLVATTFRCCVRLEGDDGTTKAVQLNAAPKTRESARVALVNFIVEKTNPEKYDTTKRIVGLNTVL